MFKPNFAIKPEGTATVSLDDICPCHDRDERCLNCQERQRHEGHLCSLCRA